MSQDMHYPECRAKVSDPRLTDQLASRRRFAAVVATAALGDPVVSAATTGVTALAAPVSSLESPSVV
ncbi:MAG: enterotoxin, partial [Stackebrandtia sp.]